MCKKRTYFPNHSFKRIFALVLCVMAATLYAQENLAGSLGLYGGNVAQSVASFQLPDRRPAIAAVFAYSDSLTIFVQNDPNSNYGTYKTLDVGMNAGPANDLPRQVLVFDANQDATDDLIVLCSGNPNIYTRGCVQVFEGRPDGDFIPHEPLPAEPLDYSNNYYLPVNMAAARLNDDARLDLVIGYGSYPGLGLMKAAEWGDFEFEYLISLRYPEGGMHPSAGSPGATAICADLNGDGRPDLVAGCGNNLFVASGMGMMHFGYLRKISLPADEAISSIAVADLSRSSSLDVIAGSSKGKIFILPGLTVEGQTSAPIFNLPALPAGSSQGVSDVAIIDWNRDSYPDVAVVNRLDNLVSIISPQNVFSTRVLPVAQLPRRCHVMDFNHDGVPDLITANEGDQYSAANPDVSILINPNRDRNGFRLMPLERIPLAEFYPNNIGKPAAAVHVPGKGFVVADMEKWTLPVVGDDGGSLAPETMPAALIRKDISGIALRQSAAALRNYYFSERRKSNILEFQNGQLINTINIYEAQDGGISGLAFNESAREFWLLLPRQRKLLICSQTGQMKWNADLPAPFTKLAVDFDTGNIFVADSGANRIERFQKSGNYLIRKPPITLNRMSPLLLNSGVGALAWKSADKKLGVFTTDHVFALLDLRAEPSLAGLASLQRGRSIIAVNVNKITGEILALDNDAIPAVIKLNAAHHPVAAFSLGSFLTQRPMFRPAAISFDTHLTLGGEIAITDAAQTGLAIFNTQGAFVAYQELGDPQGSILCLGQPVTGLDMDDNTQSFLIRSRNGLVWRTRDGVRRQCRSVDGADPGGVSLGGDSIFTLAPRGRRIDKVRSDGKPGFSAFLGSSLEGDQPMGLSSKPDMHLLYVSLQSSGDILIFKEEKITAARSSWNSYE